MGWEEQAHRYIHMELTRAPTRRPGAGPPTGRPPRGPAERTEIATQLIERGSGEIPPS